MSIPQQLHEVVVARNSPEN